MSAQESAQSAESDHIAKRIVRWASEWIETLRVAPPFSQRRRDLIAASRDIDDPDAWVEAERPEER